MTKNWTLDMEECFFGKEKIGAKLDCRRKLKLEGRRFHCMCILELEIDFHMRGK